MTLIQVNYWNKSKFYSSIKCLFDDLHKLKYRFFITNGQKIINYQEITNSSSSSLNWENHFKNNIIWVFPIIKGGGLLDDILDNLFKPVFGILETIFSPIVGPLIDIGNVFIFFTKFIIWFGKILIWAVQFILFIFQVMVEIPKDLFASLLAITSAILLAIPQTIINLLKLSSNLFAKYVVSGFWGWDKVPNSSSDYKQSTFWKEQKENGKNKCYAAEEGRIPFSVLLGTVLMPPIGVFMTLGLSGWFHIFISALLTFAYYVPGLLYGLMIVYS